MKQDEIQLDECPIGGAAPLLTVWFDGNCPLCQREIALMQRLDWRGAIRFVNANLIEASACPTDRAELLERFHAQEGERLHVGAAAFAAMWRAIPLLKPLGLLARLPGMTPLLDMLYRAFLRVRPWLQASLRSMEKKNG